MLLVSGALKGSGFGCPGWNACRGQMPGLSSWDGVLKPHVGCLGPSRHTPFPSAGTALDRKPRRSPVWPARGLPSAQLRVAHR